MTRKSDANYIEATYLKVLRPQTAAIGKTFDTWITSSSANWQRIAVVQLTRYLCLEHPSYRQDLEENATSWKKDRTESFAVTDLITDSDDKERQALVGIMTFRQFRLDENPILYHCYLHPFFRGRGLMQKAWKEAEHRYPKFEIEPPLSPAMKQFLTKVNCLHVLPST